MAALRRLAMVLGRCVPAGHSGPMLAEAQGGVRGLATNAHARAKFYADPMEAVKDISDRAKIMVGGFGLCGIPENLIKVLLETHVKDLTVVSSNVGMDDFGLGLLLETKQIPRIIGSHVGGACCAGTTTCRASWSRSCCPRAPWPNASVQGRRGALVLHAHGLQDPGAGGRHRRPTATWSS